MMEFEWRKSWDLVVIIVLSLITVPIMTLLPDNPLRIIIGVPLTLFFPGYCIIAALLPGKNSIDTIERIALSFGLSISIVSLIDVGLKYNFSSTGLDPVLSSISAFSIATSVIAAKRRAIEAEPFPLVQIPKLEKSVLALFGKGNKIDRALNVILVIAIATSIVALVYFVTIQNQVDKFTEFYLLGPDGTASNYPGSMAVGEDERVIIGIANHEHRSVDYTVEIWLVNATFVDNQTIIRNMFFLDSLHVKLNHTEPNIEGKWNPQWELNYTFSLNVAGEYRMWFLLYKDQAQYVGTRYQDYVGTVVESKIVDAVKGDIQSLSLSLNVRSR